MYQMLPYEMDLFDDSVTMQSEFLKMYCSIAALGTFTAECLERLVEEEEAFNARIDEAAAREEVFEEKPTTFLSNRNRDLLELYRVWSQYFVTHMESLREVRHYTLEGGVKYKGTHGGHIFFELTRLNYLVHYPRILEEMDNLAVFEEQELSSEFYFLLHSLKMTKDQSFVAIVDSFDISALYEEKEDPDQEVEELRVRVKEMWDAPIMRYTQSQVEILVFFLTQQINDVRREAVEEYRKVFLILWLRIAQLCNEFHSPAILDDEEMRHGPFDTGNKNDVNTCAPNHRFIEFCFFYMGELLRRFFYYDMLIRNQISPRVPRLKLENVKKWITHIANALAEDAFDDLYAEMLPVGYNFMGDDGWFKFSRTGVHSRGACIAELRPHLHKRFFSEAQVTRESVLASTRDSYVSRLFVLRIIDEHLRMTVPHLRFLNAVVVMNDGIEQSAYKLQMTNLCPLLLQVFSSFWVYHAGRVHVCDDIYEAVGVWFWLLCEYYNGHLYDCDLREQAKQVIKEDTAVIRGNVEQEEVMRLEDFQF